MQKHVDDNDEIANPIIKIMLRRCGKFCVNTTFFDRCISALSAKSPVQLSSVLLILHLGRLDLQNSLVNLELENLILENPNYLGYVGLFLLFLHYLQPAHYLTLKQLNSRV